MICCASVARCPDGVWIVDLGEGGFRRLTVVLEILSVPCWRVVPHHSDSGACNAAENSRTISVRSIAYNNTCVLEYW